MVAKGVFRGVGRIVEIPNLPTDPGNVSRDDLVFPGGTVHIVSTTVGGSFSVNPRNCLFSGTAQQTGNHRRHRAVRRRDRQLQRYGHGPRACGPQPRRQRRSILIPITSTGYG